MQQSLGFLPPLTEETLHQGRTFFGPDTGCDFGPVVEVVVVDVVVDSRHRARSASFSETSYSLIASQQVLESL